MSNGCTEELFVKFIDGENWELHHDFSFDLDDDMRKILGENNFFKDKGSIVVPKGFLTDFASIPRAIRPIFMFKEIYNRASVLHDYLYHIGFKIGISRKQSDMIFRHVLHKCGFKNSKAQVFYITVRLFGYMRYRKRTVRAKG